MRAPHQIRTVIELTLSYEALLTLLKTMCDKETEHEFVLSDI